MELLSGRFGWKALPSMTELEVSPDCEEAKAPDTPAIVYANSVNFGAIFIFTFLDKRKPIINFQLI